MTKKTLFTSESVSEGHPDKVADQISDAILDAFLAVDPYARVACETQITNNHLVLAGEITAAARPAQPLTEIAREVIRRIGYTSDALGFDCDKAVYTDLTHTQSREIGASVAHGGAGDQGLMFGYACDETPELMPLAITVAHKLVQLQSELRNNGSLPWLRPDAKSQVTVQYENDVPVGITTVVLSTQHDPGITQQEISDKVRELIILPVVRAYFPDANPVCLVNPSGSFTIGGPYGDTGLTGRKIIVDSYGGSCPHGGGAFSGKDPSKVDRSGAYAARWVAKHIVAAGLAKRCTVQVAYAIGVEEPVSLYIDFHGTARVVEHQAEARIRELFDLRPRIIIEKLRLRDTRYEPTAAYGHFGRNAFPWEQLDPAILEKLKGLNPKIDHESDKISIREKLAAATDEELIALHNQNSTLKGHSQRVLTWVHGLHDEIRRRNIDSEVITDRDERGRVCGYHSQLPVALREVNGKKILVPDAALK